MYNPQYVKPYNYEIVKEQQPDRSGELSASQADNLLVLKADRAYTCPRCGGTGFFTLSSPDPLNEIPVVEDNPAKSECPLCEGYGYTVVQKKVNIVGYVDA